MRILRAIAFLWPVYQCVAQNAAPPQQYAALCSGCHGERATGTERGPGLVDNRELRSRSVKQIQDVIRKGTQRRYAGVRFAECQASSLATWIHSLNASAYDVEPAGDREAGERFFFGKGQCGSCHMVAGRGGVNGPDLSNIGKQLTLPQLEQALVDPVARMANRSTETCPGWAWCPDNGWTVVDVRADELAPGSEGFARNQGKHDLQVADSRRTHPFAYWIPSIPR